ncbi:uncharacterized protein LOC124264760 [Haliotis rubra]|uniref:uncharacterized protein LOC124264760 n=1 Tax=Haliotis rubra TaxID=36100 RepID=UPI001EE5E53E|nr:uncharacterized protein LOC124264760 [Haliotis rubra]
MKDIVLEDNQKAKVCLFDHPQFGAVITDKASEVKRKCNIAFILLTKNTKSDRKFDFVSKEAVVGAYFGQEDPERPHVVLLLHTQPERERDYDIPEGFLNSEHYNWFKPLSRCTRKIGTLFSHYRKPAHLRSGHGSNVKCGQQSALASVAMETQLSERSQALTWAIERSMGHLTKWKEDVFYPTFATKEAVNTLMRKGSVFLVGKSGIGKTSSAYHIITEFLSMMREDKSFEPLIISHTDEIKLLSQNDSFIVLADNIFGKTNFTPALLESWKDYFPLLEKYVQNGSLFFIATSKDHIKDDCHAHIADLSLLQNMIDTTSEEYRLKTHEKDIMFMEYLERYQVEMPKHERKKFTKYDLDIGFPQCCKLYFTNTDASGLGPTFFQKPYLQLVVSDLKKREKVAYMVLVLVIFEDGKLAIEKLNPFSELSEQLSMLGPLKQACGIQQNISSAEIREKANVLCKMGYLQLNFDQQFYEFSHQSIYDVVGFTFGKDYVNEILKLCPFQFLLDHTILSSRLDDRKQSNKHAVSIPECYTSSLLKRIVQDIDSGNIRILEHNSFCSVEFVEKAFEDSDFRRCLERLLSNTNLQEKLKKSNLIYVLSAYGRYNFLMEKLVSFVTEMKADGLGEVLHDILEGTCTSGSEKLFNFVIDVGISPCKQCILRASECNLDVPGIMEKLMSASVSKPMKLVLENLVKRGRLKTLKHISQNVDWQLLKVSRRKQRLYSYVCSCGSFEMIKFLLDTIGKPDRQNELLKAAVTGDSEEILKYLLSEENKNTVDRHGRTLLHYACLNNSPLWKYLHEKGVDSAMVDKYGATALHLACESGSVEFVKTLILEGFDVTVTNIAPNDLGGLTKLSPLHSAAKNDLGWSLVELLIENGPADMKDGAMVNFTDRDGSTPLHISSKVPCAVKMIRTLIKYRCNTEEKNKEGRTALHIAARANIPSNIQCLLDNNATVNSVDNNLKTPLHYAASLTPTSKDDLDAQSNSIGALLSQNVDVSLQDAHGNTAIHIAAIKNISSSIFEKLLKKAEHVQHIDYISVLKYLMGPKASTINICKLLKYHPETIHSDGESFLQIALATGSPFEVVRLLMERKASDMSVNWECISLRDALIGYSFDETVEFLHICEDCFSPDVMPCLMHFFCEKKFSDEQWTKVMDILMKTPSSLSAEDKDSRTALHKTTHSPNRIEYLIKHSADINAQDNHRETALHVATRQGHTEGVKCLLRNGADRSIKNIAFETPLLVAIKSSLPQTISLILKSYTVSQFCNLILTHQLAFTHHLVIMETQKGIMISVLTEDEHKALTAYHLSFSEAIILELLAESSVVDVSDASGNTALHYAVSRKHLFVKILSSGADINSRNNEEQTCLHLACKWKMNSDMIQYLLDRGLSPCAVDANRYTPLMYALSSGLDDVGLIKGLLEPFSRENEIYSNILHLVVECAPREVIEHVLQVAHMFIWTPDSNGKLPIHYAIARADTNIAITIIKALKAEYKDKNKQRSTNLSTIMKEYEDKEDSLLHVAATYGNVEMLEILLGEGFDVNTPNKEANTPLHLATESGHGSGMEHLLTVGANPNVSNNEGLTPLHVASSMGAKDLIHILLTNGASVNKCSSKHGRTALHFACGKNFSIEFMSSVSKLRRAEYREKEK